jgi:hypothetical protein
MSSYKMSLDEMSYNLKISVSKTEGIDQPYIPTLIIDKTS